MDKMTFFQILPTLGVPIQILKLLGIKSKFSQTLSTQIAI